MNKTLALIIFLLTIFIIQFVSAYDYPPPPTSDSVFLGDVKVLTLYSGKFTKARRTRAIPQISCVGGSAAGRYDPNVIQCTNMGWDGNDYQWKCDTDLPDDYRLGRITVSCEGYNNPQDRNILIGSCGVEYELDYTERGKKKVYEYNNYDRDYSNNNNNSSGIDFTAIIAWIVVIVMFFALLSLFCGSANTTSRSDYSGNYGGGSGSGSGGGPYPNYPPPPYGDNKNGASAPSSGPGFWTGAATGGMLGYMFGNRNSRTTSGWSTHNSSSSSSSSSSPSSSRTSSGFGGTKRR